MIVLIQEGCRASLRAAHAYMEYNVPYLKKLVDSKELRYEPGIKCSKDLHIHLPSGYVKVDTNLLTSCLS